MMYADDNDGWLPYSITDYLMWDYLLSDYVNYDWAHRSSRKDFSIFHCPSGKLHYTATPYRSLGYGYNRIITYDGGPTSRLFKIETPDTTLLMADLGMASLDDKESYTAGTINNGICVSISTNEFVYRHSERTNVLFADGHVASCAYGSSGPKGTKWENGGSIY